jgi:hypothetical protein
MTAKYSGAPREIANRVTIGAKKASSRVPIVPATHEPRAAVANAWAARPPFSHQVALDRGNPEDDSAGVFKRIDVVDPPYIPPSKVPASMMIAPLGSRL